MRVLIIEDEAMIAQRITRMVKDILGDQLTAITTCDELETARTYLKENETDLVLLDLNLNGEDGFQILKSFAAAAFHTVIISAYQEKAVLAFEYGVLDFVPKPFDRDRLVMALGRLSGKITNEKSQLRFIPVRQKGQIRLIEVSSIMYFKGSDIYSEIHLLNGEILLHDKTLEKLAQLLEGAFERTHKSYLVSITQLEKLILRKGKAFTQLKNGEELPIGRTRYEQMKENWL